MEVCLAMEVFTGDCIGGPLEGMKLNHWAKTKEFFRPMMAVALPFSDNIPIESVKIGEYKLNDFGQWHWWETESGKAYNKLFNGLFKG